MIKISVKKGLEEIKKLFSPEDILLTVEAGESPDNELYHGMLHKDCEYLGIQHYAFVIDDNKEIIIKTLYQIKDFLISHSTVRGIIFINMDAYKKEVKEILGKIIKPELDIDNSLGFDFYPQATADAAVYILEDILKYEIKDMNILLIGRGRVVGQSLFKLLDKRNANVMRATSNTSAKQLWRMSTSADAIISAVGKPHIFNKSSFENCNIPLIDCGVSYNEEGELCGDIEQDIGDMQTSEKGCMGPLTRLMLFRRMAFKGDNVWGK